MAISKIIGHINPPKCGWRYKVLQNVINYILNPEKTAGGLLCGAVNCSLSSALQDMIATKEHYGKNSNDPSNRLGYHFVISFKPDSINESTAYAIIKEFVEKYLGQDYEAVFGIHNDKGHIHGHICFNSVRFTDGKKYRYASDSPSGKIKGDWRTTIQPLLDQICQEHGVNTLEMDTGISLDDWTDKGPKKTRNETTRRRNEYYNEKTASYTKNEFIMHDIDDIILRVKSMEEFYNELRSRGYLYKIGNSKEHGRYLSVLPPSFSRYRKTYQLGAAYTLDAIERRIKQKNKPLPILPNDKNYRFYIPLYLIRFRHVHYMKKTELYPALRFYYARLYRLGIKPKSTKSNYFTAKEILKDIRSLEKQMELVYLNQISDSITCQQVMNKVTYAVQVKKEELSNTFKENKPYKDLIQAYKTITKLDSYAFLSTEQEQKFQEAKKIIAASGKTDDEIVDYVSNILANRKELRNEIKQLNVELDALQKVYEHFNKDTSIIDNPKVEADFKEYQRVQMDYISQNTIPERKYKDR